MTVSGPLINTWHPARTYPLPIIDHLSAARAARDAVWSLRKSHTFRNEASAIQTRHGSRRSGIRNRGQRSSKPDAAQMSLPLGE